MQVNYDNNKLIADFMGILVKPFGRQGEPPVGWIKCNEDGDLPYDIECWEHYNPDTDFPQLYEVLKKIEQNGCIIEMSMCLTNTCRIYKIGGKYGKSHNTLVEESIELMDVIYATVINF